ncbi:hypothetical protein [Sessilibacter sp. MAH2]
MPTSSEVTVYVSHLRLTRTSKSKIRLPISSRFLSLAVIEISKAPLQHCEDLGKPSFTHTQFYKHLAEIHQIQRPSLSSELHLDLQDTADLNQIAQAAEAVIDR